MVMIVVHIVMIMMAFHVHILTTRTTYVSINMTTITNTSTHIPSKILEGIMMLRSVLMVLVGVRTARTVLEGRAAIATLSRDCSGWR